MKPLSLAESLDHREEEVREGNEDANGIDECLVVDQGVVVVEVLKGNVVVEAAESERTS